MRKLCLLFFTSLFLNSLSGQRLTNLNSAFSSTYNLALLDKGSPVNGANLPEIKEGSPYFQNEWVKSNVFTPDHLVFQNLLIKINLLENQIHYLDTVGNEKVITIPLSEITIEQKEGVNKLHFIEGRRLPNPKNGWFQVLVDDTITLVKGFTKTFDQRIPYGSGPEYRIFTKEFYYVYFYYQEFDVQKPSDFARIIPSKESEIKQQIQLLSKKLPLEQQLISIAAYCNKFTGLKRF